MTDELGNGRRHEERGPNGRPDPSSNVLDLVEAAIKRQDDLREAESRHVREIAGLRAEYQSELRKAETERIDAIRAVDVGAVQRAAEVQAAAASALATQVAASAEAMRTQVAATATAAGAALATALVPIQSAVTELRQVQFEQAGQKAQIAESRETTQQTSVGSRQWIAIAIAATALLSSGFLATAAIVVTLLLRG